MDAKYKGFTVSQLWYTKPDIMKCGAQCWATVAENSGMSAEKKTKQKKEYTAKTLYSSISIKDIKVIMWTSCLVKFYSVKYHKVDMIWHVLLKAVLLICKQICPCGCLYIYGKSYLTQSIRYCKADIIHMTGRGVDSNVNCPYVIR